MSAPATRTALCAAALAASLVRPLAAQRLPERLRRVDTWHAASSRRPVAPAAAASQPDYLAQIMGGLVGLALGGVAGGYAGVALQGRSAQACEDCGLESFVVGAMVGSSLGLPLGVHLADAGSGNLLTGIWASMLIGGAGIAAVYAFDSPAPYVVVPLAQLVASIAIENHRRSSPASP